MKTPSFMKTCSLFPLVYLLTLSCRETTLMGSQIWAWGDNTYGQLLVPLDLTNAVAVSAGYSHALALRADGTVVAWGDNRFGQTNVPPDLTNVVAVTAGSLTSYAVKADGSVVAWGVNSGGQLNIPPTLSGVVAISAGGGETLALKSDKTVVAWGPNSGLIPPGLTNVVAVSSGDWSLALQVDGTLRAWGNAPCGYNDNLVAVSSLMPNDLSNVLAVSVGQSHALVLLANGTVTAIGCNTFGQTSAETNVPPDLTNAIAVSAGAISSLALTSDGRVVAWGWNTNPPPGLVGATSISAGQGGFYPGGGGTGFNLALANVQQPQIIINFVGPLTQTVQVGSQAFFSVSASGATPLRYQWYFGTNVLAGATNQFLSMHNVQAAQAGTYTVLVSNSRGSLTSQPVTLNVTPRVDIFMVPAISLTGAVGASFRIDYINAVGPTNSWTTLATVTLANTQQFYSDYSAIGQPSRIYRTVQLP